MCAREGKPSAAVGSEPSRGAQGWGAPGSHAAESGRSGFNHVSFLALRGWQCVRNQAGAHALGHPPALGFRFMLKGRNPARSLDIRSKSEGFR